MSSNSQSRISRLIAKLPENIDCALITSDINRRYFTGMKSSAGVLVCFREEAFLLIDFRYIEKATKLVKDCKVILLESLSNQLNDLMKKHSVKTIAVESKSMTLFDLSEYQRILPDYMFDTTNSLSEAINNIRSIKTQDELNSMQEAQRIAESSFLNILNFIEKGRTEKEIAFEIDSFMLKNGAEALSFDTIALCGKNTSLPHGVPTDTKVKKGDFILMDYGAVVNGYHSDMTRTVCLGTASEEMNKVYEIVLKAQELALSKACEGIKGKELDAVARDYIKEKGYGEYFGHSLGHGVGMEIHEFPNASVKSETILKENMVITIEPGIYLPDKFGVRIEDFIIITKDGHKNMTISDKKLISL